MCELMALSFQSSVSAGFALREFGPRGQENPDGWGLGWYPDRSLALVKQPRKWAESSQAQFLETDSSVLSSIVLAHVRHKTMGGAPTHADTHPFAREHGKRDYCFAHNGTLDGPAWDFPLGRYQPIGDTDSERFFCHLLHRIEQRGSHLDTLVDWQWLHETLASANGTGKLNMLLSDGHRLFVYHDVNGWKGLNYRQTRIQSGQANPFENETLSPDDPETVSNHGVVVATCPLSPTGWESFHLGELMVFEAGEIRFSSHPRRLSRIP